MKTFKFSLVLRTRENTDVFISLDDNIYGIHSKRINILYLLPMMLKLSLSYEDMMRLARQTEAILRADGTCNTTWGIQINIFIM